MKYTKTINLDVNKPFYEVLHAKQNDNARYLLFNLLNNGVPFVLTDKTVRAYAIKPDGTKIYNDLTIINAINGQAELQLTSQMLAVAGMISVELAIFEGTDILSTVKFAIEVTGNLRNDDAIESTNEFSALINALASIDDLEVNYAPRLTTVESSLSEKAPQASGSLLNDYWFPPIQGNGNQYVGQNVYDPMRYYDDMWDTLMNKHLDYITRTLERMDASNTYPIYKYVFEPKNFEKEIILVGFLHGDEHIAQKNLFNFLVSVADKYETHPNLTYMREKVRIVVVPIINPWGVANNSRQNANNVDLNRNWGYGWYDFNPTATTGKGTEPYSEAETQVLKSVIEEHPNATAVIDTHNTPSKSAPTYYVSVPAFAHNHSNLVMDVANAVSPDPNPSVRITQSIEPTLVNYAGNVKNLHAVNIEWVPGNFGNASQGAQDMTEGLKFFSNIIMQVAKLPRVEQQLIEDTKAMQIFSNELHTVASSTATEILALRHTFQNKSRGVLILQGHATVSCNSATNVYLSTAVIQSGDRTTPYATQITSNETYLSFSGDASERKLIPVNSVVDVFPVGESYGVPSIAFFLRSRDGSSATMNRFRGTALFIPSHGGESAKRLSVASGVLTQVYPSHPK